MAIAHAVIYNNRAYDLVSPDHLASPRDFGVNARFISFKSNEYSCTYVIEKDELILQELSGYLAKPSRKGLLNKLLGPGNSYPPGINGIDPLFYVLYEDLSLPLKYTGNLILGTGEGADDFGINPEDPNTFAELLTFKVTTGKIVELDRIKGNAPALRIRPPYNARIR